MNYRQAKALYSFEPKEPNELGFKAGDMLAVADDSAAWVQGYLLSPGPHCTKVSGCVPHNYLELTGKTMGEDELGIYENQFVPHQGMQPPLHLPPQDKTPRRSPVPLQPVPEPNPNATTPNFFSELAGKLQEKKERRPIEIGPKPSAENAGQFDFKANLKPVQVKGAAKQAPPVKEKPDMPLKHTKVAQSTSLVTSNESVNNGTDNTEVGRPRVESTPVRVGQQPKLAQVSSTAESSARSSGISTDYEKTCPHTGKILELASKLERLEKENERLQKEISDFDKMRKDVATLQLILRNFAVNINNDL